MLACILLVGTRVVICAPGFGSGRVPDGPRLSEIRWSELAGALSWCSAFFSVVIGAQLSQPVGQEGRIESRRRTARIHQVGKDVAYFNGILNDRRSLQFGLAELPGSSGTVRSDACDARQPSSIYVGHLRPATFRA